jgi:hypothetical protein
MPFQMSYSINLFFAFLITNKKELKLFYVDP